MKHANGHMADESFLLWRREGEPCAPRASGRTKHMLEAVRVGRGGARGYGGVAAHDKEEGRG